MENDIIYKENELTIKYKFNEDTNFFDELDTFLDWLGDWDIVTASELEKDSICATGYLYKFTEPEFDKLYYEGKVTLKKIAYLDDYVNMNKENERGFFNWYYGLDR